jgi:hypothetical protein
MARAMYWADWTGSRSGCVICWADWRGWSSGCVIYWADWTGSSLGCVIYWADWRGSSSGCVICWADWTGSRICQGILTWVATGPVRRVLGGFCQGSWIRTWIGRCQRHAGRHTIGVM